MSDTETKARIVAFLTKHRDWYEFNERHFERTPDLDEALDELLAEGHIRRFISNDRWYFQIVEPGRP